jgi:hypothetical protein
VCVCVCLFVYFGSAGSSYYLLLAELELCFRSRFHLCLLVGSVFEVAQSQMEEEW